MRGSIYRRGLYRCQLVLLSLLLINASKAMCGTYDRQDQARFQATPKAGHTVIPEDLGSGGEEGLVSRRGRELLACSDDRDGDGEHLSECSCDGTKDELRAGGWVESSSSSDTKRASA